jgi:hypothetical protein
MITSSLHTSETNASYDSEKMGNNKAYQGLGH